MSKFEKFISKFQLVRIRSRKLTVIVLVVAIVLSMGALTVLHLSRKQLQNRTDELREQAAHLEKENSNLAQNISEIGTVQGIKRIASQMLDLVEAGGGFFTPGENNP